MSDKDRPQSEGQQEPPQQDFVLSEEEELLLMLLWEYPIPLQAADVAIKMEWSGELVTALRGSLAEKKLVSNHFCMIALTKKGRDYCQSQYPS